MKKVNKTSAKLKIGDILIQEGIITPEQLDEVLAVQKSKKVYQPIGEICLELKYLSRARLNRILNKNQKSIRIGDLLINLKLITPDQLLKGLEVQKSTGGKLGKILVKKGYISEGSLISALTIQMGVPKIVPDFHLIDKSLLENISEEFLEKNEALPAFREDDTITVIMSNPLDEDAIRIMSQFFKCRIEPAIAPSSEILKAIRGYYQKATLGIPDLPDEDQKDLVIGDTQVSIKTDDNISGVLDFIITNALIEGASDIHIEPKDKSLRVRYRVDGILRHKTDLPVSIAPSLCSRIKAICGLDIAEKRRHQDGRIEARIGNQEIDLRISVYASVYGENIVIRILQRQSELIELDSLGISPYNRIRFQNFLDQPSGIILVTGPTGSGKTTTLYASINYLNDGERSIITVEDPVEYTIDGVVQGQMNPKLGHTYTDFLKSMMRQDPDVIMVGEIRDNVAAAAVIQAALTGHKVLTTFHTEDSTGALLRMMDMGIDTFLISSTVVSVVAQRLVRVLCPNCREPHLPDPGLLASFNIKPTANNNLTFYQPVGCSHCGDTGFKGRTAIHELLCVNDAIREGILERKTSTQIRQIAREKADMLSLLEDGFYKASLGVTSLEEILRVVFFNEGDMQNPREAGEIIALCEGTALADQRMNDPAEVPGKASNDRDENNIPTLITETAVCEGEVYRVRLDVTTIESDTKIIEDLFRAYQSIMKRAGIQADQDLLEDFINFIVYTAKRLEISHQAEFIEFCIRTTRGETRLFIETLIPKSGHAGGFNTSRETGMRLTSFLIPSSGMEMALLVENNDMDPKAGSGKNPSLFMVPQKKSNNQLKDEKSALTLPTHQSAALYMKHVEELDWDNNHR